MALEKPSPELSGLLETAIIPFQCMKKPMFGCPSYFMNGNMFAGVYGTSLFIRLPEGLRKELLVAPFPGHLSLWKDGR